MSDPFGGLSAAYLQGAAVLGIKGVVLLDRVNVREDDVRHSLLVCVGVHTSCQNLIGVCVGAPSSGKTSSREAHTRGKILTWGLCYCETQLGGLLLQSRARIKGNHQQL